ncbi:hypothetical protein PHYSODRAFT_516481, partial [Phytophthora sojae]
TLVGLLKPRTAGENLSTWLEMGKTSDDVFKLLKLDDGVENLLAHPNMNTWASYVEMLNKQRPGKEVPMLETMTKTYGDAAVAKMIEEATKFSSTETMARALRRELLEGWSSAKKSPDEVFKLLQLDEGVENLLTNPAVNIMLLYADAMVANALKAGRKVKATEDRATELQGLQFNRWVEAGIKPRKVIGSIFSTKHRGGDCEAVRSVLQIAEKVYPSTRRVVATMAHSAPSDHIIFLCQL